MDWRSHRNLEKRRLYLGLLSGPCSQRLSDFLFLLIHQLFLGFPSLSPFCLRTSLHAFCTFFNINCFHFFGLISLPLPAGVATPIFSIAPFLIGTPEEVPIIRSQPNQVAGKSYAYVTQPPLEACHSVNPVLLLTAAETIPVVDRDKRLLDVGAEEILRLGVSLIVPEPT